MDTRAFGSFGCYSEGKLSKCRSVVALLHEVPDSSHVRVTVYSN